MRDAEAEFPIMLFLIGCRLSLELPGCQLESSLRQRSRETQAVEKEAIGVQGALPTAAAGRL